MKKRWTVKIRDVAGEIQHEESFWRRRKAQDFATFMYSPLYDVLLVHEGDRGGVLVSEHVRPDQLLGAPADELSERIVKLRAQQARQVSRFFG